MKKLNRNQLRRVIMETMTSSTYPGAGFRVVEFDSDGSTFFLRHPDLEGGEMMVDDVGEVSGALEALKELGYTHVRDQGERIDIRQAIHMFNNAKIGPDSARSGARREYELADRERDVYKSAMKRIGDRLSR